ncbi:uncharacterized protein N7498_005130 [Penicillium cinerascens]|uniref:Uncharacterized protein n=1 Tax=Penicillium cinerascens TaxID=70096 RepID=A0A9W9MMU0_9EURO|nr:uncharacterized protein N7498_005130 [Penicillium cinerascens]KAJ5204251.1 hypothetical protein N7498_005130 [Penicillium cinerascens]
MSTYNNQAAEAHRQDAMAGARRPSYGSSTGTPGFPTGLHDTQPQYDPATSGVNPATGAKYTKPSAVGSHPSNSYDQGGQIAGTHMPSNAPQPQMVNQATADSNASGDKFARKGEDFGRKAQGVMAGVHGAGESLRGALTGAVDRAFGTTDGAERNEEIARRGEREMQSGEFTGARTGR